MTKSAWKRLCELPEQRVVDAEFPSIIYWEIRGGGVWHQGRKLRAADADTFEVRDDEHVFLARDQRNVYHAWQKLTDVDRASFEVLADGYCRDAALAYCEFETSLKPLKGRTVERFEVLGNGFARDTVHGYYCGKPLRACTSPTTLALPPDADDLPFARDDDNVYFESGALRGVDLESWELLEDGFSRDARAVYFCNKKLPRAQVESWQQVRDAYSKDAKNVYVMFLRLPGADPLTWEPLDGDYSRDARQVFFVNRPVEGADAASFVVTSGGDDARQRGKDRHGAFMNGERT